MPAPFCVFGRVRELLQQLHQRVEDRLKRLRPLVLFVSEKLDHVDRVIPEVQMTTAGKVLQQSAERGAYELGSTK